MTLAKQPCRHSSWKWYGVRSLYRWFALGEPKNPGSSYIPATTLLEERIVLVKARSGEEALRKAEKEGRAYARSIKYTNGYGQKVRARVLKALDAYELDSLPKAGDELFSTTEEIDASVSDEHICERPIGLGVPLAQQGDTWRRFKFIDVNVVRRMLEHSQKSSPSSRPGYEHGG